MCDRLSSSSERLTTGQSGTFTNAFVVGLTHTSAWLGCAVECLRSHVSGDVDVVIGLAPHVRNSKNS